MEFYGAEEGSAAKLKGTTLVIVSRLPYAVAERWQSSLLDFEAFQLGGRATHVHLATVLVV